MRLRLSSRSLTLIALALAGCPVGAPQVDGANITCAKDSDCRADEVCDPNYGLCIAGPGLDGGPDAGPTVCVIGGQTYDAGAVEPGQGCEYCNPSNPTAWSALTAIAAPGACAQASDVCNAGVCAPGCIVGGAFVPAGGTGSNVCQICNPSLSQTMLQDQTYVPDGGCGADEVCNGGQCASGCVIDGGFVSPGAAATGNPCIACKPTVSLTAYDTTYTGLAANGGCGAGMVCDNGACTLGCYLDGGFFADGGLNEIGGCLSCDPGVSVSAWNSVADNSPCAKSGFCQKGTCESGCLVGNTFYLPDGGEQGNVCAVCDPAGSGGTAAFSPVDGIVACTTGGGDYCSTATAGSCVQACVVGTQVYDPSALDPQNDCQSCQPAASSTAFSSQPDGTNCDAGGDYCKGGACGIYCDIGGTLAADGGLNGSNPNQCCNVALATQAWTNGFGSAITTPSTTSTPAVFAVGDVTGDGIPDLVIGEANPDQIEIMQGKGDGTFTLLSPALSSPTGASPLVLADFNNDGHLDIAVANNGGNSVTVLLNQADGGFSQTLITGIKKPTALVVADLQAPGSHDLIVGAETAASSPAVIAVLNLGGGSFTTAGAGNAILTEAANGLATGNFNGNTNEVDAAALGAHGVTIVAFTNAGSTAVPGTQDPISASGGLEAIASGSLNGVALSDLIVANQGSNTLVPLLNGASGFAAQSTLSINAPSAVVIADLNGDGLLDVASASGNGNVIVFINQTPASATTTSFFAPAATYGVGAGPVALATGDLNGDGKPDLVTASGSNNNLSILLGNCP